MVTRQFDVADVAAVPGKSGVSVAFILCPHFTLMPFAAIVDTLRLAADDGDGSRQIHCRWTIVGPSLDPVEASCGIKVQPWETFGDPGRFDYLVVVGGLLHRGPTSDEATLDCLREAARPRWRSTIHAARSSAPAPPAQVMRRPFTTNNWSATGVTSGNTLIRSW
jgi:hypothetical protein